MLWEGKALREITEADIRRLVDAGLEEHLQLEYKSQVYGNNDASRKEFLLDVCMFANSAGGVLLIGVPERRDDSGQPTGAPDPNAPLGIEVENPEAFLASYDARVMEAIEERLPLESASIAVSNGRRVLALRVPNSTRKPHSVRHAGHIYFPARRERQRYHMTVREIKELVMRTTSRLEEAEQVLRDSFHVVPCDSQPYLITGMIPVFSEDFLVDVRTQAVYQGVGNFARWQGTEYVNPIFTFDGLERRVERYRHTVRFHRNALLNASSQLPLVAPKQSGHVPGEHVLFIGSIDRLLRQFVLRAAGVYEAASVGSPYVLGMMMRNQQNLIGQYAGPDGLLYDAMAITPSDRYFPFMQVDDLSDVDRIIRPFCDQAYQMFGQEGSPDFNVDGAWIRG
jgi:Putative DNA-binding domain